MPNRQWSDPNIKYKYGFNGKEKDDDITVNGGSYDFGSRIYDSRLGRFLSIDPLYYKDINISAYCFANNSPIGLIDFDGKFAIIPKSWWQGTNYAKGFAAGIVDGAWESLVGVLIVGGIGTAFNPMSGFFYTEAGSTVRGISYDYAKVIFKLMNSEGAYTKMLNSIKEAVGDWWSDFKFENGNSYAGYTHGKFLFDAIVAVVGIAEVNYFLKTGKFSVKALRTLSLNAIKRTYLSFDDVIKNSKKVLSKLDKKANKMRIERVFTGKGSAADHFDNLAKIAGAKVRENANGSKSFTDKSGAEYTLYNSTGGSSQVSIVKKYTDKSGRTYEEKVRFEDIK